MADVAIVSAVVQEPAFITYLMKPDLNHDCYFIVKSPNSGKPERIGVVRKMLSAHSVVLRAELEESALAMKGDVHVEDLFPDTVKHLFKYVYGYDTIASLCFDDADNLMYAAEKYMMGPLKDKVAIRLMSLLNTDNICSLLNNPACFKHLELQTAITKILQFNTNQVLENPQFLELSSDAILKILEQDSLSVQEITIWRAVLKWAKHKADCEVDGSQLRQQLSNQLKYVRFCTLSVEDLCKEVIPTGVLSYPEIQIICSHIRDKQPQPQLTEVCDKTESRTRPVELVRSATLKMEFSGLNKGYSNCNTGSCIISTKEYGIELLPFVFEAKERPALDTSETYQCDCTVTITKLKDNVRDDTQPPISLVFCQYVDYGREFKVPTMTGNGANVQLQPKSKYKIKFTFSENHYLYFSMVPTNYRYSSFTNDHVTVDLLKFICNGNIYCGSLISQLEYRTLT